jgi:hypothetical protein
VHKWRVIIFTQNGDQDIEENGVRTALITRLEMLLTDVTECLSTELDDVIDRIRDFSEDLYRCLANLTARNPEIYSELLHQARLLVDVIQRPILNNENYGPETLGIIRRVSLDHVGNVPETLNDSLTSIHIYTLINTTLQT